MIILEIIQENNDKTNKNIVYLQRKQIINSIGYGKV